MKFWSAIKLVGGVYKFVLSLEGVLDEACTCGVFYLGRHHQFGQDRRHRLREASSGTRLQLPTHLDSIIKSTFELRQSATYLLVWLNSF